MIVQLRLDERFIHGQVVLGWSRVLDINMIVVANDYIAKDSIACKALLMAAPADKKVNIRSVNECIRLLKNPKAENMRILVLVNNPDDAIRLVQELNVKNINIANYTKKEREGVTAITQYVYANSEDIRKFEELVKIGENVFSQMVPNSTRYEMKDLLKKL